MFIAALFIITPLEITQMCNRLTGKTNCVISIQWNTIQQQKNEWYVTTWMKLKTIMLGKRSQKSIYVPYILFKWNLEKLKLIYSDKKQISHCLGPEGRKAACPGRCEGTFYIFFGRRGYSVVHICQNVSGSTLKMDAFYCV